MIEDVRVGLSQPGGSGPGSADDHDKFLGERIQDSEWDLAPAFASAAAGIQNLSMAGALLGERARRVGLEVLTIMTRCCENRTNHFFSVACQLRSDRAPVTDNHGTFLREPPIAGSGAL
jgi:hypothetical protein